MYSKESYNPNGFLEKLELLSFIVNTVRVEVNYHPLEEACLNIFDADDVTGSLGFLQHIIKASCSLNAAIYSDDLQMQT